MRTAIRTADIVLHVPSGEEWVVAWADHESGYMAPCGWPTCQAEIADCRIVQFAGIDEAEELARKIAESGRSDAHKAIPLLRRALEDGGRGE